jgi:death-on-curing protein
MIKYLSLTQVLHIAEVVTEIPFETIKRVAQINLIESAITLPQSSFIGLDPYPELSDKAAVLGFHLARNHPLPDGNKRLAFLAMFEFCWINGFELIFDIDEAEATIIGIAAGEISVETLKSWIEKSLVARDLD